MHTVFPSPPVRPDLGGGRSIGMVSTFPPTSCGIATFSAALTAGLVRAGASVGVIRCCVPPQVDASVVIGSLKGQSSMNAVADSLGTHDVVIVQHEYGLYDGADGASILGLMARIQVPTIVVAHTVRSTPTRHQRYVLERVCEMAERVVVMTETARRRLIGGFRVHADRVVVIPHGATIPSVRSSGDRPVGAPPRVLTWGLLGPGKGIEWAIDAMRELEGMDPRPEYVIAGATHPKVRERDGEAYRHMLMRRAVTAPVRVVFDDAYRDLDSLTALIQSADLVVLPYDSREQVTSGVLVDAVAAGRPVVSTAFPHAIELLESGAGIVVPQRDPVALGRAIRSVLTDANREASMAREARRLAPGLSWTAVARRYAALADDVTATRDAVAS